MESRSSRVAARHYRYAGLPITSEVPLTLLPAGRPGTPLAVQIVLSGSGLREFEAQWQTLPDLLPEDSAEGFGGLMIRRHANDYLLRFVGIVDLRYRSDHGELCVLGESIDDAAALEHVLLDQALPRILAKGGHFMLHASAVSVAGGVICLVGDSGAGKSSLAALLAADGHALLADDAVRLVPGAAGVTVHAAYPSLRLWPEATGLLSDALVVSRHPMSSQSDKQVLRLQAGSTPIESGPLRSLLLLRVDPEAERPVVRSVAAASACMGIMAQAFSLHPGDPGKAEARLTSALDLVRACRPRQLGFAHRSDQRRQLADIVVSASQAL